MSNVTPQALIEKIQQEIDEIDLSTLSASTEFRRIEGWNSLYSLILMALVSTEFDIELTAEQVQHIKTVQDMSDLLTSLMADNG